MKIFAKIALVCALLSGLPSAPAAAEVVVPETVVPGLAPLLHSALAQSPRMVSRAIDLEIAENNRIAARAGLLPSFGGYVRVTEARDEREDIPGRLSVGKTYYDVSINQALFHWGDRMNSARIGAINEQIAKRNYREAYRGLAQEIRQKFLGLIVQKLSVARARHFLGYAQQQVALAEDRLAKRVISDRDIHPIRLTAEHAQIAYDRAVFDFETAKHSFAQLAGLPRLDDAQIPETLPPLASQAAAVDRLLGGFLGSPELPATEAVNARRQLEVEELNLKMQRTRLLPKLSLVVGVSQDDQSYTINIAQRYRLNSQYAGVSVNWTIFDGFAARSGVRNALARKRQLANDYAQMADRISQQAQIQAKHLEFSARYMVISDRALSAAESNLKAKQEEFARGVATETDVSVTTTSLYDAMIGAYNARVDYLLKTGDFLGTVNADPAVANLSLGQ
jgi:outer membrane protein TolC